ncbi:hypothetical protein [Singulisphaera sp. PoT]|uniref:hypothetical protein n=1 Tax=Singulisphaera sp. PoT TaxID=3411797 RepID=UPI003BF53BF4
MIEGRHVDETCPLPFDVPFRIGDHWLTLRPTSSALPEWAPHSVPSRAEVPPVLRATTVSTEAFRPVTPRAEVSRPPAEVKAPSPAPAPPTSGSDHLAEWRNRQQERATRPRTGADQRTWEQRWKAAGEKIRSRNEGTVSPAIPPVAPRTAPMPPPARAPRAEARYEQPRLYDVASHVGPAQPPSMAAVERLKSRPEATESPRPSPYQAPETRRPPPVVPSVAETRDSRPAPFQTPEIARTPTVPPPATELTVKAWNPPQAPASDASGSSWAGSHVPHAQDNSFHENYAPPDPQRFSSPGTQVATLSPPIAKVKVTEWHETETEVEEADLEESESTQESPIEASDEELAPPTSEWDALETSNETVEIDVEVRSEEVTIEAVPEVIAPDPQPEVIADAEAEPAMGGPTHSRILRLLSPIVSKPRPQVASTETDEAPNSLDVGEARGILEPSDLMGRKARRTNRPTRQTSIRDSLVNRQAATSRPAKAPSETKPRGSQAAPIEAKTNGVRAEPINPKTNGFHAAPAEPKVGPTPRPEARRPAGTNGFHPPRGGSNQAGFGATEAAPEATSQQEARSPFVKTLEGPALPPPREDGASPQDSPREWPRAADIFSAYRRPEPREPQVQAQVAKSKVTVQQLATEMYEPASWSLPLWASWLPAMLMILPVGAGVIMLSLSWTRDDQSAGVVSGVLAHAEITKPIAKDLIPEPTQWWATSASKLALWGSYFERMSKASPDQIETAKVYFEAASNSSPLHSQTLLARARLSDSDEADKLYVASFGLSRDIESLAFSGSKCLKSGKKESAIKLYRQALEMASRVQITRMTLPSFNDESQTRRYRLPNEELIYRIIGDMAREESWTYAEWSSAIPPDSLIQLVTARILTERGAPEAAKLIDQIVEHVEKKQAPASALDAAAEAEALAQRSRWDESQERYKLAIDMMSNGLIRRSWWINVADLAKQVNDEAGQQKALELAKGTQNSDEVSKRATELLRYITIRADKGQAPRR